MNKKSIIPTGLCVAFLSGLTISIFNDHMLSILFMFIGLGLIFCWIAVDAKEQSYQRTYLFNLSIILLTIFSVPYYLVRTRGWSKGLLSTLIFFCLTFAWSFFEALGTAVFSV